VLSDQDELFVVGLTGADCALYLVGLTGADCVVCSGPDWVKLYVVGLTGSDCT